MTRASDLAAWLKKYLKLVEVFENPEEGAAVEDRLPGAVVRYNGNRKGDTLDPSFVYEQYAVVLMAPVVGANKRNKRVDLATLERRLVLSSTNDDRRSTRWEHLEAKPVQADYGNGASLWDMSLLVSGE